MSTRVVNKSLEQMLKPMAGKGSKKLTTTRGQKVDKIYNNFLIALVAVFSLVVFLALAAIQLVGLPFVAGAALLTLWRVYKIRSAFHS